MRVSNQMMSDLVIRSTAKARDEYFIRTRHMNTNRRLLRPADDLVDSSRTVDHTKMLKELDTMSANQKLVHSELLIADMTLMGASDLMKDALGIAVQMRNDSFNAADRAAAAGRIVEIRDSLLALANKQQPSGRYLFGGTADNNPPYDPVTGAYLGSATNRAIEIAPSYTVDGTITGAESFGDPGAVFTTLQTLANDLTANNVAGVETAIGDLQTGIDGFARALTDIGSRLNAITESEILVDDLYHHFEIRRGELRDADIPTEITKMKAAEASLMASIDASRQFLELGFMSWR